MHEKDNESLLSRREGSHFEAAKEAIVDCHLKNPLEGYRRLTFMMLDAGIVAVSPSSVWRVLERVRAPDDWIRLPVGEDHSFLPVQPEYCVLQRVQRRFQTEHVRLRLRELHIERQRALQVGKSV
jgi:hypothetical protein